MELPKKFPKHSLVFVSHYAAVVQRMLVVLLHAFVVVVERQVGLAFLHLNVLVTAVDSAVWTTTLCVHTMPLTYRMQTLVGKLFCLTWCGAILAWFLVLYSFSCTVQLLNTFQSHMPGDSYSCLVGCIIQQD